jgi:hypothetical protein
MYQINISIIYTIELDPCTATLFGKTYYMLLVSSGMDFKPHPNRYPSDYFNNLLNNTKVSSTKQQNQISEN